jgi:exopolyphosphatase/guanosine-5'-triphosphate,3'-diphosphate pyrophosphatase
MIIEQALKEKKLINKEAIIDLGSNSIRMLIYDNLLNSQIPIFNEKAICELGKNLDKTGKLDPKGSEFALSVLQRFKRILINLKVKKFKIIGTAAVREATDSKLFISKVQKIFKKKVEVLTGIEEAENSALGVIIGFQKVNGVVADLGGGSLELARVEKNIIYEKVSLPLGVLRLFNQPKRNKDKINSIISFYLNKIEWLRKVKTKNLYLCGGTWRTLLNAHIFKTNYPLSILHQYKLSAYEALKFSNKLLSVKSIKSEKLVSVTKSRTNYIPIGSYILSSLIKICDPSNVLCSVSGVREGSLINKAYLNILEKDSLNRSVHFIALKKGDFGENYIKLYNFLKKIFTNNDEDFPIRLLLPACSLSNFDWGLGTYQRAELVFQEVINSPILKLSHNDRIKLGLVSFWRHCSTKYYPDVEFLKLLSNSEIAACRRIGAALRFASSISVISSIFYEKIKIYVVNNKTLILKVPKKHSEVISNQVQKRLKSLAEEMNLKQEIIYTA